MARIQALKMLYDDRADITPVQLERILQGVVWLADVIILPTYARPSLIGTSDAREDVSKRLGALAEAGYVARWVPEPTLQQAAAERWWPKGTRTYYFDRDSYIHVEEGVQVGVSLYRQDTLRGVGGRPRRMMSGISEFVSLRDSLWTIGLAKALDAEYLLSSETRSLSLSAPLRRLESMGRIAGPISETIMELHQIGSLLELSVEDVDRLRKFKPTARALIGDIIQDVDRSPTRLYLDQEAYLNSAIEATRRHYSELVTEAVRSSSRSSAINNVVGLGISIAGTIFPPLSSLAFAQPLMSWDPHGRSGRRLVSFLTKLRKRVDRHAKSGKPPRG